MASFLSSYGRIPSHFDNICLKLPTHVCFIVVIIIIYTMLVRSGTTMDQD